MIEQDRGFTHKDRPNTVHDEDGYEKQTFETLDKTHLICDEIWESMANIVVAWISHQQCVSSVLIGMHKPKQIVSDSQAANLELDPSALASLNCALEGSKKKIGPDANPWRKKSRIGWTP